MKAPWNPITRAVKLAWRAFWNDWRWAVGVGFVAVLVNAFNEPAKYVDRPPNIAMLAALTYIILRRMFVQFARDRLSMDAQHFAALSHATITDLDLHDDWVLVSMTWPGGNHGYSILKPDTFQRLRRNGDWPIPLR